MLNATYKVKFFHLLFILEKRRSAAPPPLDRQKDKAALQKKPYLGSVYPASTKHKVYGLNRYVPIQMKAYQKFFVQLLLFGLLLLLPFATERDRPVFEAKSVLWT